MKKKGLVLFLLSALLFTACGTEKNKTEETDKLTVVTSFYPVYLLAQEIVQGAEGIRLENMAQPQTGCLHDYELSISDMKLLETKSMEILLPVMETEDAKFLSQDVSVWQNNADWMYENGILKEKADVSFLVKNLLDE